MIDVTRYSRQLPIIGLDGQKKLHNAKVLVVGAGGLGSPVLLYLAAAGVGLMSIVDGDVVDVSNLQRQVLFDEHDVGQNKAMAAVHHLQKRHAHLTFYAIAEWLSEDNAKSLIANHDVIVDATDNFKARYLINRFARLHQKPLVSASIFKHSAQIAVFNHQQGPCYECLYPKAPPDELVPNCAEGGIMGVVAGLAGLIQANEAIKVILNEPVTLSQRLMTLDTNTYEQHIYPVTKKPHCTPERCSQYTAEPSLELQVKTISALDAKPMQNHDDYVWIDVREPYEREIAHIGGLHIPLINLSQKLNEIPKDKTIIVYCKGGARSAKAARLLIREGYQNVLSLDGGIMAWRDACDRDLAMY